MMETFHSAALYSNGGLVHSIQRPRFKAQQSSATFQSTHQVTCLQCELLHHFLVFDTPRLVTDRPKCTESTMSRRIAFCAKRARPMAKTLERQLLDSVRGHHAVEVWDFLGMFNTVEINIDQYSVSYGARS
jgi:hypothetical protein